MGQRTSQTHHVMTITGSAKFVSKHPVVQLNDLKPGLKYQEQPTNNDFVCMIVEVGGRLFEGYGVTKKQAKKKAAEFALKDLFNIICVEGLGIYHTLLLCIVIYCPLNATTQRYCQFLTI